MTAERIAELRARWTKPPNPVVIELLDELDIIANLERERDAATERLASAKALDAQARTDWDRLTRELEAERAAQSSDHMLFAKHKATWEADRDNFADCWQKAEGALNDMEIAKNECITTLEATISDANEKAAKFGTDYHILANDCAYTHALDEKRITELEAALEEARKAIDPFYRFACMRLALPPKNQLGDNAPLRNVLPGSWPTVADLNTLHAAHERIKRLIPEGKP